MCRGALKIECIALSEQTVEELERIVELIRGERGEGSRVLAARLVKGLRLVHEALIAPALALLPDGIKYLTISPGAQLVDVPFEALLDSADVVLAARYTLTFAVSSAQLATRVGPHEPPRSAVLWRPDDELEHADREDRWLGERLQRAGAAVRRVSCWSEGVGTEADLIHYAGHAGFMGEALSEGGLDAASFVGERFGARPLVVLSACETGRAQTHGEELVGFLRAVFGAGASALVCAGWRAHDAATEALMQSFYEALLGGLPAPDALRHATQTLPTQQRAWRHPFFWACWRCWIGAAPPEARR
jgi:CHAT domain-containing protein